MSDINVDLKGLDEIQKLCRISRREMDRAIKTAANTTARRMRTEVGRALRARGITGDVVKVRVLYQKGKARIWIGINPVRIRNLASKAGLIGADYVISGGRSYPTFTMKGRNGGQFTATRIDGRIVNAKDLPVDIEADVEAAAERAVDLGERIFLQEVEKAVDALLRR